MAVMAMVWVVAGCSSGGKRSPRLEEGAPAAIVDPDFEPVVEGRDLRRDPPAVETVEAEVVDAPQGDVKLRVTFAPGEKLPASLVIDHDGKRVRIHDDGKDGDDKIDGVFTARVKLDLAALSGEAPRAEFDGRVARPARKLAKLDLGRLRPGIRIPIDRSAVAAADVSQAASLMIRDLGVVEDKARTFNPCTGAGTPMGKWTFGYLMEQLANQSRTGISPSAMARAWVEQWLSPQKVNGFGAAERTRMKELILDPWEKASGGSRLDLSKAPFRLLAIVNRIDLADNLAYGAGSAGEGRFVFAALDRTNGGCTPMQFTVIFEYGVDAAGCRGLKAWAKQWFDLNKHPIGTPAYNTALERITETFARANAAPRKPNGSALNQLRTNEIALARPWQLREFQLDEKGQLRQTTVKLTPDNELNATDRLSAFFAANQAAILAEKHDVPLEFPPGSPFLGGASQAPSPTFTWRGGAAPAISSDLRFHFSLNTCNGCHTGETATLFTHVHPEPFGTEAGLSGFLTGVDVNVDGLPAPRHFADLERRQQRMADILGESCVALTKLPRMKMTH